MTYILIGIGVFVAILIWHIWLGGKPARHHLNLAQGNFEKYLETLLYRGYNRGFLVMEAPDAEKGSSSSPNISTPKRKSASSLTSLCPMVQ